MIRKEEKHLDLELLVFFFCLALLTFFFFIFRHPLLFSIFKDKRIILSPLFLAYSLDLIIFLAVLIPYLLVIVVLILIKILKKVRIQDNIMVILFFPLLSFFTKGMSLLHVYLYYTLIEVLKENFAFFSFLFVGPIIVIIHKTVVYIKKRKKED